VAFSAISVKGRREYFRDFDTILPIFYIPSLRSLKALTAYTFVTKAPRQLQRVYREILGRDKLPLDESLMGTQDLKVITLPKRPGKFVG
jgi:hypothetical protein